MPSALDLSEKWLCDTGAAYDLVSWEIANNYTDFQSPTKPINFQTANCVYRADTTLSMSTPGLGEDEASAYVMNNTPSALSVGQRVMHREYSFIWIKGKGHVLSSLARAWRSSPSGVIVHFMTKTPKFMAMTMKDSLHYAAFA